MLSLPKWACNRTWFSAIAFVSDTNVADKVLADLRYASVATLKGDCQHRIRRMTQTYTIIMTFNGGSSSITFALYQVGEPLERRLHGKIDRIGLSGTTLTFNDSVNNHQDRCSLVAFYHKSAANFLMDWFEELTCLPRHT